MKYLVASDLHGSAYYARLLEEAMSREGADRLILLGDLLYHGPRNDLPREYAPKKVIPILNQWRDQILCVRGNCDSEVDQMVLDFPILGEYAILAVEERLIYLTHGHIYHAQNPPPLRPGDLLLHGHTHLPAWEPFGRQNWYLNPGSLSIPKGGSLPSYMTLEGTVFRWKTLDGETYHCLDVKQL